jgi:protein-S-isoprenylcysteine O-methyltransferase Ste14
MINADQLNFYLLIWIALAVLLFPFQLKITAPYGRHTTKKWGPVMDNRLGWLVMESISIFLFGWLFLAGDNEKTLPMWLFFAIWMGHYAYRSFIYPYRTKTKGKVIPVSIVLMAIFFNVINGFTNGYYIGSLAEGYTNEWFLDIRFILGIIVFASGAYINFRADNLLLSLRKPGETGYKIPEGGMFKYISCPNLFGEILEWFGFAIMCWNLPALAFAVWTAANLIPRAFSHHRWYKSHFVDYPEERKAVIPWVV